MRRHLRAVSDEAPQAIPGCGHSLFGHLDEGTSSIRCPECGVVVPREVFGPRHRTPREFKAFPP